MSALRCGLFALVISVLLSCGGGGDGAHTGPSALGTGASVAGTDGSANGIGGIAADDGGAASSGNSSGSTTTASGGDDGSGVGSGGTGVTTADATGVGAVDGAGSIIVNGLRYDTRNAAGSIEDAPNGIQLGMSVKVTGPVNADFTRGIARWVESAADIRGPVTSVDQQQGSFVILGTTVTTDDATVWADAVGLGAIALGQTLQVWGLPAAPGVLLATRIEQRPASSAILSGTVENLDPAQGTFNLGSAVVDYSHVAGGVGMPLANGALVRVRADARPRGTMLVATQVQWWYPVPRADNTTAQVAGIVTDFAGLQSLRVLGVPVDASAAQITGDPRAIGNGVKLEVGGVVIDGVLRASKLKIRYVPGTGGQASFALVGEIGAFNSPSDFRLRGQPVNAGGPGVVFVNGQVENLGYGVRVRVHGTRVVEGVLVADSVTFE